MAKAKVRAPRHPLAGLFDALVVLAGMWLAGGLAAAAGWSPWLRWLAAALVWPVVPFALLILVSPRLGLQRVAVAITWIGVAVCAVWWRPGLYMATTTYAVWMAGETGEVAPSVAARPELAREPVPVTKHIGEPSPPANVESKEKPQSVVVPVVPVTPARSRCFRELVRTDHADSVYGTTLVDMDGDGVLDAVAIDSDEPPRIRVWKGDREGRFHAASEQAYADGGLHFAVLDFDRDGKLDVATADFEKATVTLWKGAGDGSLTRGASQATYRSPIGLRAADLDNDGFSDLVVAHYFHVEVMRGGKGGKFKTAPWLKLVKKADKPGTLLTPEGVAVAELTGDGLLDLVIPKGDVTSVEVWAGRGRGSFRRTANIASCYAPSDPLVADVDEDGAADVVIRCGEGHLELFAGDGKGGLAGRGQVGPDQVFNDSALFDLTGDGHLDLISPTIPGGPGAHAFATKGVLTVHAGDGKGKFAELDTRELEGIQHRVVAVVDIDGDERRDVVYECVGQSPGGHLGVAFGTGCALD